MIFDDMKRIFHENRELLMAVLPSEEDAPSLSDSRFKLKELRQSSIGKKCFRGHQAFIDLVDERCRFAVWSGALTLCFILERAFTKTS